MQGKLDTLSKLPEKTQKMEDELQKLRSKPKCSSVVQKNLQAGDTTIEKSLFEIRNSVRLRIDSLNNAKR